MRGSLHLTKEDRINEIAKDLINKNSKNISFFNDIGDPIKLYSMIDIIESKTQGITSVPMFEYNNTSYICDTFKIENEDDIIKLFNYNKDNLFIIYLLFKLPDNNYALRGKFIKDISIDRNNKIDNILN